MGREPTPPADLEVPVGAVALGLSGALYAGANLEFLGQSLSLSVHAEQAAVYNAWVHGEAGVSAQYESEVVYHSVIEELQRDGVLFCDMDTALREYPEIVQKYSRQSSRFRTTSSPH